MKQYLLSVYQPEGDPPSPAVLDKVMGDVDALNRELKAAGAWVFNGGLHAPSTATVVRLWDGEVLMTDGPFAEGKEYMFFSPWVITIPGVAIFTLVLAINLLGDGVRDLTAPENRN